MSQASPTTTTVVERKPRPRLGSARTRVALVAAGVIALGVIFFVGGDPWLSVLNTLMIYAIATLGLNVLSGYAGQISLGIAFFMGIGAYAAAWVGSSPPVCPCDPYAANPAGLNLPFVIWLPAAGVAAALVGALIGPTALRLKGFYLAIVTLALIFIGKYLFLNLRTITGGASGRSVPSPGFGSFSFSSPDPIFGFQVDTQQLWFLLLVVVLGIAGLFVANIARSRTGRAWQAVRDNEVAAAIMGVNLVTAKMGAFILSSFLAGIAGALSASYITYTTYTTWSDASGLVTSIALIAAILIGGVASVWGSILGAAFVFALPTVLSNLPQSASSATNTTGLLLNNVNQIVYGLLIIVFLLFEPAGLIGLFRRVQILARRFTARRKGGASTPTPAISPADSQFEAEMTKLPHGGA